MSLEEIRDFVKSKMKEDHYVDPRVGHQKILPSGFQRLDQLLKGGLRSGTFVEFFGQPASGKTFLALNFAAQGQRLWQKPVLYMDYERAWNPDRAEELGIDLDYVVRALPPTQEKGFDFLKKEISSDMYSVIIIDSVSAMLPDYEAQREMGDNTVALNARINSKGFRNITPGLQNTTVIFINQLRENIGVMYGDPNTTTGGRALGFYAHTRLGIGKNKPSEKDEIEEYDSVTGSMKKIKTDGCHIMRMKLEKSRFGNESHRADLVYSYDLSDVDRLEDVYGYLLRSDVIKREGAWFTVEGREGKLRKSGVYQLLIEDEEEKNRLLDLVNE